MPKTNTIVYGNYRATPPIKITMGIKLCLMTDGWAFSSLRIKKEKYCRSNVFFCFFVCLFLKNDGSEAKMKANQR